VVGGFFPGLFASPITNMMPTWFWITFGIVGYCYPMLGLVLEGAPAQAYLYYITYPIYGITWFPVTVWGLFKHGNQTEWAHTSHYRGISINTLETAGAGAKLELAASAESNNPPQLQVHTGGGRSSKSKTATPRTYPPQQEEDFPLQKAAVKE